MVPADRQHSAPPVHWAYRANSRQVEITYTGLNCPAGFSSTTIHYLFSPVQLLYQQFIGTNPHFTLSKGYIWLFISFLCNDPSYLFLPVYAALFACRRMKGNMRLLIMVPIKAWQVMM
jgi:hypothetical protein